MTEYINFKEVIHSGVAVINNPSTRLLAIQFGDSPSILVNFLLPLPSDPKFIKENNIENVEVRKIDGEADFTYVVELPSFNEKFAITHYKIGEINGMKLIGNLFLEMQFNWKVVTALYNFLLVK